MSAHLYAADSCKRYLHNGMAFPVIWKYDHKPVESAPDIDSFLGVCMFA